MEKFVPRAISLGCERKSEQSESPKGLFSFSNRLTAFTKDLKIKE